MTLPLWPTPQANAAVNGISATNQNGAAPNSATASTITVDADEGAGDVQMFTSYGNLVITACNGVACVGLVGNGTSAVTIPDAGNNVDTITAILSTAGFTGPSTAAVTATQGGTSRSINILVTGPASKVTLQVFRAASGATLCNGSKNNVIRASDSAVSWSANTTGFLCTTVTDANGNPLVVPVIYSTTRGTVTVGTTSGTTVTATTNANGIENTATITSPQPAGGSPLSSGTEATISASAGGITATTTLKGGGDITTPCTLVGDPATVQTGGSSTLTATFKDATGGPVPDGVSIIFNQANPGAGANAAIVSPINTSNGTAKTVLIAAIPGAISVIATPTTTGGTASGSLSCTTTIQATGTTVVPTTVGTGTPAPTATVAAGCSVTPNSPYTSGLNAVVVQGSCTAAAAASAVATSSGKQVVAEWVLTGGAWIYFLPSFPSVNGGLNSYPGPVASAIFVLA